MSRANTLNTVVRWSLLAALAATIVEFYLNPFAEAAFAIAVCVVGNLVGLWFDDRNRDRLDTNRTRRLHERMSELNSTLDVRCSRLQDELDKAIADATQSYNELAKQLAQVSKAANISKVNPIF